MTPVTLLDSPDQPGQLPIKVVRPLLDVPKARLLATLQQRGIGWIEDPSNQSPAFERVRLRAVRAELDALGLTQERLAGSARRLQRVRAALDAAVESFCDPAAGNLRIDRCGYFSIDRAALRTAPAEIGLRVLLRAIAAAGGLREPVPLAQAELIAQALCAQDAGGSWTLARAMIAAAPQSVVVSREPGRQPLPCLTLAPGSQALWDGRFWVRAGVGLEASVEVRGVGAEGLRQIRQSAPAGAPVSALRALPAFCRGKRVIAVPSLQYCSEEAAEGELTATFAACDPSSQLLGCSEETEGADEA